MTNLETLRKQDKIVSACERAMRSAIERWNRRWWRYLPTIDSWGHVHLDKPVPEAVRQSLMAEMIGAIQKTIRPAIDALRRSELQLATQGDLDARDEGQWDSGDEMTVQNILARLSLGAVIHELMRRLWSDATFGSVTPMTPEEEAQLLGQAFFGHPWPTDIHSETAATPSASQGSEKPFSEEIQKQPIAPDRPKTVSYPDEEIAKPSDVVSNGNDSAERISPMQSSKGVSQASFNRLASKIETLAGDLDTYYPGDPEEMAYVGRELARHLEEFVPIARAIATQPADSVTKATNLPRTLAEYVAQKMVGMSDGDVARKAAAIPGNKGRLTRSTVRRIREGVTKTATRSNLALLATIFETDPAELMCYADRKRNGNE